MKKRAFLLLLVLGIVLLLAACEAKSIPDAPDDLELIGARSKGLLFAVTGDQRTLYLFGSVHLGREDMYPLSEEVYHAFENSDVLALELDVSNLEASGMSGEILSFMSYQEGELMTDIVPEELFNEVAAIIDREMGIPPFLLVKFKPWVAVTLLVDTAYERAGLSEEYGVEAYFAGKAAGREIIELETIEEQLAPFGLLSDESQVIYLEKTLREMNEFENHINMLIAVWQNADIEALAAIREEMFSEAETESLRGYYEALTDVRDVRMADRIEKLLHCAEGKTYFVIVGALHLTGENSIVGLLRCKGYAVELIR